MVSVYSYNGYMNRYQNDIRTLEKVKVIVKENLPGFAARYFGDNLNQKAPGTLLGYALDLKGFFEYLETISCRTDKMTLQDLDKISPQIIEDYLEYCKTYRAHGVVKERSVCAICRRYSSLSSFFSYFYRLYLIDSNPLSRVKRPDPIRDSTAVPSNENNQELIDWILKKDLGGRKNAFREHTRERDLAIILLLMGTGMKISAVVNLDINDLHLEDNSLTARIRKSERTIFFSDMISEAIGKYLEQRLQIIPERGDDTALFLSLQRKRICPRAVQKMIKKYSSAMFDGKDHLTAGSLNQSFRNNVFEQTSNINLTAEACGNARLTVLKRYRFFMEHHECRKGIKFMQG